VSAKTFFLLRHKTATSHFPNLIFYPIEFSTVNLLTGDKLIKKKILNLTFVARLDPFSSFSLMLLAFELEQL
jgi:hypothetical protein